MRKPHPVRCHAGQGPYRRLCAQIVHRRGECLHVGQRLTHPTDQVTVDFDIRGLPGYPELVAATRVGDVDGYGLFGVLDETDDGLLCHDCGWRGQHLGSHVYRALGVTASGYRFVHGLKRTRGLVAASTRAVVTENAT